LGFGSRERWRRAWWVRGTWAAWWAGQTTSYSSFLFSFFLFFLFTLYCSELLF
jgi:hypothetical protein